MSRPAGANTPGWMIWILVAVFIAAIVYAVEAGRDAVVDSPPSPAVSTR